MTTISNKVRYYHSDMTDAPELSNTAGALIAVLDACLVNGFGTKNINSLTVAAGIATALISSGHDFGEGDVIRVAGATPAGLNSDWRIASVTADTVTWSVEGLGIADGSATGTITCLLAPAGWEKVFSGTNRAAYRSLNHAEHNGMFLYVDDTGTTTARVRGFEAMTDIDSGSGPFPTDAQLTDGAWWAKAHNATGTRKWAVAADAISLVLMPAYVSGAAAELAVPAYQFGRLRHTHPSDLWATCLSGAITSGDALTVSVGGNKDRGLQIASASDQNTSGCWLANTIAGDASSRPAASRLVYSSLASGISTYPAATLGSPLFASEAIIFDGNNQAGQDTIARGVFRGPAHLYHDMTGTAHCFTPIGVPGNGAVLMRYEFSGSRAWLLSLGHNGSWE